MSNNFAVRKICHKPERVNGGIIILLTTLDGNVNSVRVSLCTELSIHKNLNNS